MTNAEQGTNAVTTTGRSAETPAATTNSAGPVTTHGVADATNPGPHNPDTHGVAGHTQDTVAQKLEDEAVAGKENRY